MSRQRDLVKYGVRHHAHPVCLYKRRGEDGIRALHDWQIRQLPVIALVRAGLSSDRLQEILRESERAKARLNANFNLARIKQLQTNFRSAVVRLVEECEYMRDQDPIGRMEWFDALTETRECLTELDAALGRAR